MTGVTGGQEIKVSNLMEFEFSRCFVLSDSYFFEFITFGDFFFLF